MSKIVPDRVKNLLGVKFGNFEVVGFAGQKEQPNGKRKSLWEVRCVCGNIRVQTSDGVSYYGGSNGNADGPGGGGLIRFDASRVVPTADEFRPRNVPLLACIKY